MGFIQKVRDSFSGARKARRDIDLVTMFYEEHNGEPGFDLTFKFLSSLGDDVAIGSQEHLAYRNVVNGWKKRQGAEAKLLRKTVAGIDIIIIPVITTGQINEDGECI